MEAIGNLGIPVYYAELYDSLYIYNADNPHRQPIKGGRRIKKTKIRKIRKTRKTRKLRKLRKVRK